MEKHVSLYFTEGSSDKEYHVNLVPDPAGADLWQVDIAYGRRGKPMTTGVKGQALSYAKAETLFEKTVESKTKKGYTPASDGRAFSFEGGPGAGRSTGVRPQLLTAITGESLNGLLGDPDWIWQEKMDGERRILIRDGDEVVAANRNGLAIPVDSRLAEAVRQIPESRFTLDGEDLGGGLFAAFDLLSCGADPDGARPYADRLAHLEDLLAASPSDLFVRVPTARTPAEAEALLQEVERRGGEGVVGKNALAPHVPGRGADQVKYKFVESCTAIVTMRNEGRRSVALGLLDESGATIPVGNVTIPANHKVPAAGELVEVQYLYAYEGGSLYQPVYKGARPDQALEDCVTAQLKYRGEQDYERHTAPADENAGQSGPGF